MWRVRSSSTSTSQRSPPTPRLHWPRPPLRSGSTAGPAVEQELADRAVPGMARSEAVRVDPPTVTRSPSTSTSISWPAMVTMYFMRRGPARRRSRRGRSGGRDRRRPRRPAGSRASGSGRGPASRDRRRCRRSGSVSGAPAPATTRSSMPVRGGLVTTSRGPAEPAHDRLHPPHVPLGGRTARLRLGHRRWHRTRRSPPMAPARTSADVVSPMPA